MHNFINPDNRIFSFLSKMCDLILVNLLTIVCSLPIFTIGTAVTAAYTVSMKLVKDQLSYTIKGYFRAFKDNFKKATPLWLINLAAIAVIVLDLYYASTLTGGTVIIFVLRGLFYLIALLVSFVTIYLYALTAKFENSRLQTLKNAFFMSLRHLPWTLLLLLIWAAPWIPLLFFTLSILKFILPFMLLFGVGIQFFLSSLIFNHIFLQYMPKDTKDSSAA